MSKIESFIERSISEAIKHQQNDVVFIPIRLAELESLIEKSVHKALNDHIHSENELPDIGGVELAMKITNYKKQTIYQMVSAHRIPYIKRGGKLFFSKHDLFNWLQEGRNGTIEELTKDICVGKM